MSLGLTDGGVIKHLGVGFLGINPTYGDMRSLYRQALDVLRRQFGTTAVRVDSGGTLNGVLLRAGLVDELHVLVHPTLVGGITQKTFFLDTNSKPAGEIALRFLGSELHDERILLLSYAVEN